MRTRKTAYDTGPRDKHPSHGRKPRTRQPVSEVRFGVRTDQGDVFETTPSERLQDSLNLAFEREQQKADMLRLYGQALANIDLPDHW